MRSESPSLPTPRTERKLRRRSPLYQVELLHWSDDTTTVNVTQNGLSQTTHGPFPGPLSFPEALIAVGVANRMEKP